MFHLLFMTCLKLSCTSCTGNSAFQPDYQVLLFNGHHGSFITSKLAMAQSNAGGRLVEEFVLGFCFRFGRKVGNASVQK